MSYNSMFKSDDAYIYGHASSSKSHHQHHQQHASSLQSHDQYRKYHDVSPLGSSKFEKPWEFSSKARPSTSHHQSRSKTSSTYYAAGRDQPEHYTPSVDVKRQAAVHGKKSERHDGGVQRAYGMKEAWSPEARLGMLRKSEQGGSVSSGEKKKKRSFW